MAHILTTKNPDTLAIAMGHDPERHAGMVNIPPYHGSTILFPTVREFIKTTDGTCPSHVYARYGNPTIDALEETIARLDGADHCMLTPSGLAAITVSMLSFCKAGDHILIADSVYGPTRAFAVQKLTQLGIDVEFYDPTIGGGIRDLLRDNTAFVFVESPGSLTLEVQDVPAIAQEAHKKGALVLADNTWATPLHIDAFGMGVDVNIHSATKYINGHSDLVMGAICVKDELFPTLRKGHDALGACTNGQDAYYAMRGLRTMPTRIKAHEANGMKFAEWLQTRPEVTKILHPAFDSCPGHKYWKRDFSGACGLFSFIIKPCSVDALSAMLDHLTYYGMGYSWGGYESLLIPMYPAQSRTAAPWKEEGQLLRIHIGLENTQDLIDDLAEGFDRLNKAM